MGLKDFLKKQGFIEDDAAKVNQGGDNPGQSTSNIVIPTFFPIQSSVNAEQSDPSFVTPLTQNNIAAKEGIDPSFVKFFEDELAKANLPGPDYFEFRQLLTKTQQKMVAKGSAAPEVVLQAVMMSFEAQDISPAKLIDAANQYKTILKQKNDDFIKGAEAEKNNQLQKRQSALQQHDANIKKLQDQLQQLEQQRLALDQALNKEKTQQEVDKSLGQEGIEKIGRAEKLIAIAHNYIQSTIDTDIKRLQSV